jgi:hypothetical protein
VGIQAVKTSTYRPQFPNPPTRLFWKMPFEFISPLSLEECAKRLEMAVSQEYNYAGRRGVRSYGIAAETILFYLWQLSPLGKGWVFGNLKGLASGETLVIGEIGVDYGILIRPLLLGVILFIFMLQSPTPINYLVFLIAMIVVWTVIVVISFQSLRSSLLAFLRTRLRD